jgi:hypothetical protein
MWQTALVGWCCSLSFPKASYVGALSISPATMVRGSQVRPRSRAATISAAKIACALAINFVARSYVSCQAVGWWKRQDTPKPEQISDTHWVAQGVGLARRATQRLLGQ